VGGLGRPPFIIHQREVALLMFSLSIETNFQVPPWPAKSRPPPPPPPPPLSALPFPGTYFSCTSTGESVSNGLHPTPSRARRRLIVLFCFRNDPFKNGNTKTGMILPTFKWPQSLGCFLRDQADGPPWAPPRFQYTLHPTLQSPAESHMHRQRGTIHASCPTTNRVHPGLDFVAGGSGGLARTFVSFCIFGPAP